jgi:hypothetical protein
LRPCSLLLTNTGSQEHAEQTPMIAQHINGGHVVNDTMVRGIVGVVDVLAISGYAWIAGSAGSQRSSLASYHDLLRQHVLVTTDPQLARVPLALPDPIVSDPATVLIRSTVSLETQIWWQEWHFTRSHRRSVAERFGPTVLQDHAENQLGPALARRLWLRGWDTSRDLPTEWPAGAEMAHSRHRPRRRLSARLVRTARRRSSATHLAASAR